MRESFPSDNGVTFAVITVLWRSESQPCLIKHPFHGWWWTFGGWRVVFSLSLFIESWWQRNWSFCLDPSSTQKQCHFVEFPDGIVIIGTLSSIKAEFGELLNWRVGVLNLIRWVAITNACSCACHYLQSNAGIWFRKYLLSLDDFVIPSVILCIYIFFSQRIWVKLFIESLLRLGRKREVFCRCVKKVFYLDYSTAAGKHVQLKCFLMETSALRMFF